MECPITVALRNISGSHVTESNANIISINHEDIVCDVIEYQISIDIIEMARFEAKNSKVDPENLRPLANEFAQKLFNECMGLDYASAFDKMFYLLDNGILANLLNDIILLSDQVAARAKPNSSIVMLNLIDNIDYIAVRRIDVLVNQLQEIHKYVRSLHCHLPVPLPKITIPNDIILNDIIPSNCDTIDDLKKLLECKLILLNYMKQIEDIQCSAINYLNKIQICLKEYLSNILFVR